MNAKGYIRDQHHEFEYCDHIVVRIIHGLLATEMGLMCSNVYSVRAYNALERRSLQYQMRVCSKQGMDWWAT